MENKQQHHHNAPEKQEDSSAANLFRGLGVEIKLKNPDDFLKIRETLSRIGVASKKDKILYQSCHILHKKGRFAIMHFKELFILDGKPSNFDESDIARRNTIADLLSQWELIELIDPASIKNLRAPLSQIKIVKHGEKSEWNLVVKYSIGKKKSFADKQDEVI
jgi:hypothetical protein